jgi:hypothetical protein
VVTVGILKEEWRHLDKDVRDGVRHVKTGRVRVRVGMLEVDV